jgi:hypothetical protein
MDTQTKLADKDKLNTFWREILLSDYTFWREILLSDDAQVSQPSPTNKELRLRACETWLPQRAADGHDTEDRLQAGRDLRQANGNRA